MAAVAVLTVDPAPPRGPGPGACPASARPAADAGLPHRDRLLDAGEAAARIGRVLGGGPPVTSAAPVRAKYRIGESLRVVYRVVPRPGDAPRLVTARMFAGGLGPAAPGHRAGEGPDGLLAAGRDAELDTAWWSFPHDRRLRGLESLGDPPPLVPGWSGSQVVEYAPEKSVTARAHDGAGATVAYAKVFAPATVDGAALAARYTALATALARYGPDVAAPAALARRARRDLLLLQPMPGTGWTRLAPTAVPAAMALLGRGIARLHGLGEPDPALRPFPRLGHVRLMTALDLVVRARPELAAAAARLAGPLLDGPTPSGPPVLLHGDCHAGNALFDGDRLALIDLDQAGVGPAAADLGSLVARLRWGAVVGELDRDRADALTAAVLDGYATVRPLPPAAALSWHAGAAMVAERALRAVNRLHPLALPHLGALLGAAADLLRIGAPR